MQVKSVFIEDVILNVRALSTLDKTRVTEVELCY